MKPVFYMYLHSKLWEYKKEMSEKELRGYLPMCWKIPKSLVPLIIIELQKYGCLKKSKREKRNILFEVTKPDFNLSNLNELYGVFKIF